MTPTRDNRAARRAHLQDPPPCDHEEVSYDPTTNVTECPPCEEAWAINRRTRPRSKLGYSRALSRACERQYSLFLLILGWEFA